ncbi:MAG: YaiO family outer membrane beta-barrel protein [Eudoraea sp.]|nr:YaiO family outer membrane beta-barrel protein [Eudoraea sp.]NNJ40185.1 YaiO family outer membrane beta-barrel protein [Eudoraea sp.]
MNTKGLIVAISFVLGVFSALGQKTTYEGDPDISFSVARSMAFAGDYHGARDTLNRMLSRYPEYSEARGFLARTYSWDGMYAEARKQFNRITSREKRNKEVWVAAIKNEIYAENEGIALGLANKALIYIPEDSEILSLREDILYRIAQNQAKSNSETTENKEKEQRKSKNRLSIGNAVDVFDVGYDPMIYATVEYTRETSLGKIIPRLNYSNRFNQNGWQYEVDLYPKISKKLYAYLNYGYSQDAIYPRHRGGAELYWNLPNAMEVSAGMRYLAFASSETTILTGSVGWYKGNYYLALRPYITPTGESTGFSGNILGRRYFKHKEHFLGINMGMGYAPELRQLSANNALLAETLFFVESQQIRLEYQFTNRDQDNLYRTHLGITRQEFVTAPNSFFWALTAGMQYQIRF